MAPSFYDYCISELTVLARREPWQNPHIHTSYNSFSSAFHLFCPPSTYASVYFFVNKSLNLSSCSAAFLTLIYGHHHMRSPVEGAEDTMIYNVYSTRNVPHCLQKSRSLMCRFQLHPWTFSHVFAAFSNTSANHVLLGDLNIHYPNWGHGSVRPDCFSLLLFSLQELHDLSLLLLLETVAIKKVSV